MTLGTLEAVLEDLIYRHARPQDRIVQERRIVGALREVVQERIRQEQIGEAKRSRGIPWRSCADPLMDGGDFARTTVLGEEFGEVSRSVLGNTYGSDDLEHLRKELIEVMAVSLAWVESIDERREA